MATRQKTTLAVGIDLGTSYSSVAIYDSNGRPEVIPNETGSRVTPSCVAYTTTECLTGEEANERLTLDPVNTVYESKRLLGRTYSDTGLEKDLSKWPFKIINDGGKPKYHLDYQNEPRHVYPEMVSGQVIRKMKQVAENYIKQNVTHAVITVPAFFNDSQRKATISAAKTAGLKVLGLLNEPTAVALAYSLERKPSDCLSNTAVLDLGGGTFDVSILEIESGSLRVLAAGGDTHLGGTDFDENVLQDALEQFSKANDIKESLTFNSESGKLSLSKLRKAIETAKEKLTERVQAEIKIKHFHEELDLNYILTRAKFEDLNQKLFTQIINTAKAVLHDAKLHPEEIDDILLVGGSSYIPKIRELVRDLFDGKSPHVFSDPDGAVAVGAAIQAAILSKPAPSELAEMSLSDVNPLTLGLNSEGGVFMPVIRRNSHIPCRQTRRATTSYDNQKSLDLVVYQGERPKSESNHFLGVITIDSIPPGQPGDVIIDVTFELDVNGCLTVSVDSHGVLNDRKLHFDPNKVHVSDAEVKRLLEEAKAHERKDQELKRRIQARNELIQYHQRIKTIMDSDDLTMSPVKKWAIVSKVKDIDLYLENKHQANEFDYHRELAGYRESCKALPTSLLPQFNNVPQIAINGPS